MKTSLNMPFLDGLIHLNFPDFPVCLAYFLFQVSTIPVRPSTISKGLEAGVNEGPSMIHGRC